MPSQSEIKQNINMDKVCHLPDIVSGIFYTEEEVNGNHLWANI
jgi:hypothetical protein